MNLSQRIDSFQQLGVFIKQFTENQKNSDIDTLNQIFYDDFLALIEKQKNYNGWFTKESVLLALQGISLWLTSEALCNWVNKYFFIEKLPKNIGVIMAGNIPMVGFHDMLSVLITGNNFVGKCASTDNTLIQKIAEILVVIEPKFNIKIKFVERFQSSDSIDAYIATGSNNSARYFEYYFGKYPHIIRKNRNSVAIIHKNDNTEELALLGNDIFQFFGLGCRNVSKLFVPKGYPFATFFEAIIGQFEEVIYHNKYANNYDYNKAVYLLNNEQLLDNNFILLKEDKSLSSPVGVLFYEYYDDIETLKKELENRKEEIQCIVSSTNTPINTLNFGETQLPKLNDYADGVDTVKFLMNLAS